MRTSPILALLLLLALTGCAHYISEQSRSQADPTINFRMLRKNTDAYRGKSVLLGGTVAAFTQNGEGTWIEVIQYPLNSRELPDLVLPSGGRFIATTPDRLDPATYTNEDVLVTMMGEVTGMTMQSLAGSQHLYPVIAIKEIHAVEFEDMSPPWGYLGGER